MASKKVSERVSSRKKFVVAARKKGISASEARKQFYVETRTAELRAKGEKVTKQKKTELAKKFESGQVSRKGFYRPGEKKSKISSTRKTKSETTSSTTSSTTITIPSGTVITTPAKGSTSTAPPRQITTTGSTTTTSVPRSSTTVPRPTTTTVPRTTTTVPRPTTTTSTTSPAPKWLAPLFDPPKNKKK